MSQLNINMTPDFEKDLRQYMKKQGLSRKSDAIRQALHEAVDQLKGRKAGIDFRTWRGIALKAPLNPRPRFKTEDDLWG